MMVAWSCLVTVPLAHVQDAVPVYLHCSEAVRQLPLPCFSADSSEPSQHKQHLLALCQPSKANNTQALDLLPLSEKTNQTKPEKPNQKNSLLVLEFTREEFTRSFRIWTSELCDFWLVAISYPTVPCWNKPALQGQWRSPPFPKMHPGSSCVEGMAPSKVRIWLTVPERATTTSQLQQVSPKVPPTQDHTWKFWDSPFHTGNL